ncbi:MAG: ABC transporter permease [Pseudolabrys sp.]|nr:ABC transporter permease [Pseudolabrys sp.]MCW5684452.1 ABC transporter permease [Pseudolabrys sp.]
MRLPTTLASNIGPLIVPAVFAVMVLTFWSIDSRYLSSANLLNIMNQVSIMMVVTVAASLVIFTGGFDLSAGAVVALSGVAASLAIEYTDSVVIALLAGVAMGMLVGAANGFFVGYCGVSPLIVTLGALNIARGLALILAGGSAMYNFPTWFTDLGTSRVLGVPLLFVIALTVFAVFAVVLRFTTFGVSLYAAGGNAQAAELSGINVKFIRFVTYALAGAVTAIAGLMLCARTGGGEPTAGFLYELEAIAAVVLGGASLAGGEGRLWRSMVGILLLTALGNGLNIVGVHPHWKGVAIGGILVLAASLEALRRRK